MADILVVDDDQSVATAFERFLKSEGHTCRLAASAHYAFHAIDTRRPDLVFMDIRMPGLDGLLALGQMRAKFPGLVVVMMTGYGTSQTSIEAIRVGAFDYITKPPDLDDLRALIRRALAARPGKSPEAGDGSHAVAFVGLVGETPVMLELYKLIGRLAINDVPALVVGERGTGKSLVIETLHLNTPRRDQPLVVVDCAAGTPDLESQVVGATTGTVHLAHVDAAPLAMQARLARALASEGGRASAREQLGVRVLASTEQDLAQDVSKGTFSRDLLDVLGLITLRVPPLRERRDDIPLLVRHFIQRLNLELSRTMARVDDEAMKRLQDYAWPGNVEQLFRVLKRAAIVSRSEVIASDEIGELTDAQFQGAADTRASSLAWAARTLLHERLVDTAAGQPSSAFHDIIDLVETTLVKEALTITNNNQLKAAELLGVNRATLKKKAALD